MVLAVGATFLLSSLLLPPNAQAGNFEIRDAKACQNISKTRDPIRPTKSFPSGTTKVYVWFAWENASPGLKTIARWYFDSENIHILDIPFDLTKTSDKGAVSLRLRSGKVFPPGTYHVDLEVGGKIVRSIPFTIS